MLFKCKCLLFDAVEMTVMCRTVDGTATAGQDYTETSMILTFEPNTKSLDCIVNLINDAVSLFRY